MLAITGGYMINLEYLKKFLTTCKYKNMTLASNELCITQPALSKSIKELEHLIGVKLFTRTSHGIDLTPAGEYLKNNIELQFVQIENVVSSLEQINNINNKLTIGTSVTIAKNFLTKKLSKLLGMFPNLNLSIKNVSFNNKENNAIELITNNKIDVIIANQPIAINNYKCKPIHKLHDTFICGTKYKALSNREININELMKFPLVANGKNSITRKSFEKFCQDNDLSFTPSIEVENNALLSEMVKLNLGIGYTTKEFVLDDVKSHKIFIINTNIALPMRDLYIIYKSNTNTLELQTLINILEN